MIPSVFVKFDDGWIQTKPYNLKLYENHDYTLKGNICVVGLEVHIDMSEIFIQTEKIEYIKVTRKSGTTHKDFLNRDIPDFEDIIIYQREDIKEIPENTPKLKRKVEKKYKCYVLLKEWVLGKSLHEGFEFVAKNREAHEKARRFMEYENSESCRILTYSKCKWMDKPAKQETSHK